jgi:hypothetical protein
LATPSVNPRRTYLVQRLVNKQITMEEATELFTIMARENDALRKDLTAMSRPPTAPPRRGEAPVVRAPAPAAPSSFSTTNMEDVLIFGAPMIAILAALLKKSGLDAMTAPPNGTPSSPSASPTRKP